MTRSHSEAYNPIQPKQGIVEPASDDFPPYHQRVSQNEPTLHATLAEHNPERVTVQSSDVCQLSCPGCYVAEWTRPDGAIRQQHETTDATPTRTADQIKALGKNVSDIYYLGVEPTLRPDVFHEVQATADAIGATVMSITNGASALKRYEQTFHSDPENEPYKIIISFDSIDPEINNHLRGKSFAHRNTLRTIDYALERGDPIKINTTVWPDNYHTVIDTVEALYERGIRGFAFHCGSIEGIANDAALAHLDPLAWRALCAKLLEFRDTHQFELDNFTLPYIFFSEDEMRQGIIGDDAMFEKYQAHVESVSRGSQTASPVKVCPSLDIPQVYLFGNDGHEQAGAISLCNIHTIGANAAHGDGYFANYSPEQGEFLVEQDEEKNELLRMYHSPHLCPAMPYATGEKKPSDKATTAAGDLYHACRYVSANQFPFADKTLGRAHYETYAEFYKKWSQLVRINPAILPVLQEIDSHLPAQALSEIEQLITEPTQDN